MASTSSTLPTPTKYVRLISVDGFEFVVPREACFVSPVLKKMAVTDGAFIENRTGRIDMPTMRGDVLEKVAEYLIYWYRYQDKEDVPDMAIPVHMCLELLVAADYLGIDNEPR